MSNNVSSADNQQERLLMRYPIKSRIGVISVTPDYIVGLVDGEGYFSITPDSRDYGTRKSREVNMVFGIELKESDGKILEEIQKYFGCGKLYLRIDRRENFSNLVIYQVRSHQDILHRILPFFQKYPLRLQSKQNKFKFFLKIGEIVMRKAHLQKKGFEQILALVEEMRHQ